MTYIIAILMFPAAWYLNREIGDGKGGAVKHRWPVFVAWGFLGGLLGAFSGYDYYGTLICYIFAGAGYWIFRQKFSPNPAFFAGHGGIDPNHKPTTNAFIEWLAIKLFKMPRTYFECNTTFMHMSDNYSLTYRTKEQLAIEYGLLVGGLVGFLKCQGWGIIGSLLISPLCLVLPAMGMSFGKIHYFWGQKMGKLGNFRELSEKTVGILIIAPNTIIPIWFYDGGLLNLIN